LFVKKENIYKSSAKMPEAVKSFPSLRRECILMTVRERGGMPHDDSLPVLRRLDPERAA
jgi:hypothetical protein